MKIIESVLEMKDWSNGNQSMGALHSGHLKLIEQSIKNSNKTVVSLFVNKTQFNSLDDYQNYPSTLKKDLDYLKMAGVDVAFLPTHEMIYPDNYTYKMQESKESLILCGKNRPGHFDGVLTVVMKLFQIISPKVAYFGEKDFQQLELIKGMVQSFFMDIEIVACPIVRDDEGLALSSRNIRLSPAGLKKAQFFAKSLSTTGDFEKLATVLADEKIEIDYLENWKGRRLAAVHIENVRLIDNVKI